MALIETVGLNFGRKIICQARLQLTNKSPWHSVKIDKLNNYQVRYFKDRIRNGSEKRIRLTPDSPLPSIQNLAFPGYAKPIAFTVAFCTCSFAGGMIWQYETLRKHARLSWERAANMFKKSVGPSQKFGSWRNEIYYRWRQLDEGRRLAAGIIGCNLIVFLLFRIPRLQPIMMKYFCSSPISKAICWPMALSCFSHYAPLHLFFNMYALYSFSSPMGQMLGREQFLAMYLSAGVVASLASFIHKVITVTPVLSLGASGCIMGVIGFFCTQYPNAELRIIFIPGLTFSADSALKALIAFDTIGLVFRLKLLDHAAHLGGVFFGISYALWGREYIWERRETFLRWWNKIRGPWQK